MFKPIIECDSLTNGHESHDYVYTADPGIKSNNYYFVFMVCFSALLFILFVIIPVLLLLFYPIKIFHRHMENSCTEGDNAQEGVGGC